MYLERGYCLAFNLLEGILMRILVFIACVALLLGTVSSPLHGADKAAQPNILWLIGEDMGPQLACYGTPQVFTPTLDKLARDGVRYSKAFTVTPVCSTSRSSFMTGMNACAIGAHHHRTPSERKQQLPDGVRLLTGWLADAGYYTANIVNIEQSIKGTGKTDWNFKFADGDGFKGKDWNELKSRQPFYAQVNFSDAHRGFSAPKKADPAKVVIAPYYPDHPLTRKDWGEYLDEITRMDGDIARILEKLEEDGLAENTIVVFLGDHGQAMVRGKQWCYDSGLHIPLIIRWPKNFPAPKGFKAGTVDDRLICAIDLTATTLVTMAGAAKPAKMQGRVFMGDKQEEDNKYVFATRDRCDMTTFHIRTVRDEQYRYIRNFMPEKPFLQWNNYKETSYPVVKLMRDLHAQGKLDAVQEVLMADHRPAEELYDLKNDPYEIHNLAADPAHKAKLAELKSTLEKWIKDVGDQGPEPANIQAQYQKQVDEKTPDKPAKKKGK